MGVADQKDQNQRRYQRDQRLAERLTQLGLDPYADKYQYYYITDDGEIGDLEKHLRDSRLFASKAAAHNAAMVNDFAAFAEEAGKADLVFWSVKFRLGKQPLGMLRQAVNAFNEDLNRSFTFLMRPRKECGFNFELMYLVLHPHFDHGTGMWDVHAHFIARVPRDRRPSVAAYLGSVFNDCDFDGFTSIRDVRSASSYMQFGIFDADEVARLPDAALAEIYTSLKRAQLSRARGTFARWRGEKCAAPKKKLKTINPSEKTGRPVSDTDHQVVARITLKAGTKATLYRYYCSANSNNNSSEISISENNKIGNGKRKKTTSTQISKPGTNPAVEMEFWKAVYARFRELLVMFRASPRDDDRYRRAVRRLTAQTAHAKRSFYALFNTIRGPAVKGCRPLTQLPVAVGAPVPGSASTTISVASIVLPAPDTDHQHQDGPRCEEKWTAQRGAARRPSFLSPRKQLPPPTAPAPALDHMAMKVGAMLSAMRRPEDDVPF